MENNKIKPGKITPCLWFKENAEEAVGFYASVFKNSRIGKIARYGKNAFMPEGTVMTIEFQLEGLDFLALNGGPAFSFPEAISFIVSCDTQQEIDEYWSRLSDGGIGQVGGWLKDKFGLSWQIIPAELGVMLQSGDMEKSNRVMQELMKMKKIDIGKIKSAFG